MTESNQEASLNRTIVKIAALVFVLSLVALAGNARAATLGAQPGSIGALVRDLLDRNTFNAEQLVDHQPARLIELQKKVNRGILSNKPWWRDQMAHLRPGELPAYDKRLGVTRDEYREYLTLARDSIEMQPSKTVYVALEPTRAGWKFGAMTATDALHGVEIDTLKNQIHTPYGDFSATDPVVAGPNQRTTGPWGGPCWKGQTGTPTQGSSGKFAIGRLVKSGRTVIYYDARKTTNGISTQHDMIFLRVLPAERADAGKRK